MDKNDVSEKNNDKKDVTKHLKEKAREGAGNIVTSLFEQPEIQKFLLRQSIETGLFVSFFIIGVFTMFNVLKTILGLTWQTDLALASIFITIFLVYVKRKT